VISLRLKEKCVVYDFQVQNLVSEVFMVDSIDFLNELNGEYFANIFSETDKYYKVIKKKTNQNRRWK
jgi:hypothetical protein